METTKVMRIICAVLFVIGTLGYVYKLYGTVHPYLFWTIVVVGILQSFFGYCNVFSSKLGFEHVLSTAFAIGLGCLAAIFTGACMIHGYWAVVYLGIPTIFSLLVPILRTSKWKISSWQSEVAFIFLLVAIFLWDYLEKTPNYFSSYVSLQIFAIAIATQWLPEKENTQQEQKM